MMNHTQHTALRLHRKDRVTTLVPSVFCVTCEVKFFEVKR